MAPTGRPAPRTERRSSTRLQNDPRLTRRGLFGLGAGGLAAVALGATDLRPSAATPGTPVAGGGRLRTYYVAAEEVNWDYAPDGSDRITGQAFDATADTFVANGPDRIGRVYRKARFIAYTDETFTTPAPVATAWEHLGLLGPVLRAEVGDEMAIVFRNRTTRPTSIHPHGVFYEKESEGAAYGGSASHGDRVPPGGTFTYHWKVPERSGPGPHDPSSIAWMYHSHVDEIADTNAGLVGPLLVTRRGAARPDGTPMDVDREFVTLFSIIDENASPYLEENIRAFAGQPASVNPTDEEFVESNLKHAINGYIYGNLPGLTMRVGEQVRWYVIGMGNEVDLHTPHWHGQTLLWMGMRMDMVELLPMSMKTLDMVPDAPGTWLFHCHVNDHLTAGMQALFTVQP